MKVYCLQAFKDQFLKLCSKKPYKSLESELISYFLAPNTKIGDVMSGTRLNNSADAPYIKKRLDGSGGYRFYFLIIVKEENVYLMFVHPKTGPEGAENIKDESKAKLLKDIYEALKDKDLYLLKAKDDKLEFTHLKDIK